MKNKQIIVLAGGFGTRLKSILNGLPKPLADINGTPFLELLIDNLIKHGFDDFIFSLYFESDKIIERINSQKDNKYGDVKIRFIVEDRALGTGGAISNVIYSTEINDVFYVTNADTFLENGFENLETEEENLIAVVKLADTGRFGNVEFDSNYIITAFKEKEDSAGEGFINAGLYKLNKVIFSNWDKSSYSLERDLFPKLISQRIIKAAVIQTNFIDIGIPEDYNKFCSLKRS